MRQVAARRAHPKRVAAEEEWSLLLERGMRWPKLFWVLFGRSAILRAAVGTLADRAKLFARVLRAPDSRFAAPITLAIGRPVLRELSVALDRPREALVAELIAVHGNQLAELLD